MLLNKCDEGYCIHVYYFFCVCALCQEKHSFLLYIYMLLFIAYFLIHVVYEDDVEKTQRVDESKTLINSRKILEILIFKLKNEQDLKM